MSQLPTIKIQHPENAGEFIIINEDDFDPSKHKRFQEPKPSTTKEATTKGKTTTPTKGDETATDPPPAV